MFVRNPGSSASPSKKHEGGETCSLHAEHLLWESVFTCKTQLDSLATRRLDAKYQLSPIIFPGENLKALSAVFKKRSVGYV